MACGMSEPPTYVTDRAVPGTVSWVKSVDFLSPSISCPADRYEAPLYMVSGGVGGGVRSFRVRSSLLPQDGKLPTSGVGWRDGEPKTVPDGVSQSPPLWSRSQLADALAGCVPWKEGGRGDAGCVLWDTAPLKRRRLQGCGAAGV